MTSDALFGKGASLSIRAASYSISSGLLCYAIEMLGTNQDECIAGFGYRSGARFEREPRTHSRSCPRRSQKPGSGMGIQNDREGLVV
jgi:hypothetical protein